MTVLALNYENDEKNKELYIYGFEVIIGKVLTYILAICFGIIFNCIFEIMVFISFVLLLRGYTGGYHLHSSLGCIISTMAISLFSILIAVSLKTWFEITIICILLLLSSICICILAPINHPNLQLTKQEIRQCNKFSRQFLGIELLSILLFTVFHVRTTIIISACLAIIFVAILMLIAKIIKQEVKCDE